MQYVNCVCVYDSINREAVEDVEVGRLKIKKGFTVMVSCGDVHRDPQIWPDPETFDPLRHTPEARAERHPFAFMPFGMGPRNCIGMRLAQQEVRMVVATVLQHFTLVPCEKTVNPPKLMKMRMQAEDGLWVKFQPRD
ncbi:cytochrome P450 3A19-like [Littorina saxatilis]|uniref:Cytochrome P450 n=1 Tax=Littorina saxatilis TaxID=31220 RepID=A0AAN9G5G5_9CAEN